MSELDEELNAAPWKKSNRNEHEYILSIDYPDLVKKVQAKIKEEGKTEKYKNWNYKYWLHNGYRYWVMPGIRGLPKTLVLNRARRWKKLPSFLFT